MDCLNPPTAFTPNADGVNDRWNINRMHLYPEAMVQIFDRWGRMVYSNKNGYNEPWDGNDLNGRPLPMGAYFYIIKIGDYAKTGSVSIIKK